MWNNIFLILLFIICVFVLSLSLCYTAVASLTETNSSYVWTHLATKLILLLNVHYKYKQAKYTLNTEIRGAKKNYSGKLKNSFQATSLQCGKAWKPSPATRPHSPALRTINNQDLNEFYCRFEKQKPGLTPHTRSDRLTTTRSPLLFFSL